VSLANSRESPRPRREPKLPVSLRTILFSLSRFFAVPKLLSFLLAFLVLTFGLLALPAVSAAQAVQSVRVAADNDAFNFWLPIPRPDHDYTHGARVEVELNAAPAWGRLVPSLRPCTGAEEAATRCLSTRVEVGQKIFTPRVDAPEPLPGERPYAGWLYGSVAASAASATVERTAALELGVTGPPSLGEVVQTTYHDLLGYWKPRGWSGQLAFEPGVVARYSELRLVEGKLSGVRVATLVPHWGVAVGNVRAGAQIGVRMQLGYRLAHPWRAPGGRRASPVSLYASGGVRGEWIARDLFLDGNTFQEGPRVEKLPLVAESEVGAGLRLGHLRVEYRVVSRGREYRTEPRAHRYGTIAVTVERAYRTEGGR
jgi:lipid A 3-O-deacylase